MVEGQAVEPVVITGVGRAKVPGEVSVSPYRFVIVRGATAREIEPPSVRLVGVSQDTRVRRVFTEWLTAMNSGDRGQLVAFIATYGPTPRKVETVSALYDHGAVDLLRITKTDSLSLEFVIREQKTGRTEVGFFALAPGVAGLLQSLRLLYVPVGRTPDDAALLEHLRSMRP